jgi:hypothetical protein
LTIPKRQKPPESTFQQHIADFLVRVHGCAVLDQAEITDTEQRGFPKRYLRPILPSPRFLKTTVIDADEDGHPLIERQLYVIDCDLSEAVLRTRHPALWEYLRTAEVLVPFQLYLPNNKKAWGHLDRSSRSLAICPNKLERH